jgi:hypothetical protein
MAATGDLEPLANGGDEASESEEEGTDRVVAYIACPVCREPIALPATGELPPRLVCEACGAVLER